MKLRAQAYIVAGAIILAALFLIFKSSFSQTNQVADEITTQEATTPTSLQAPNNVFDLIIQNKKIISGPETISVQAGDDVTIIITSNEPEEFHLHGYDQSTELEKDIPVELKFTANLSGKFPFELENSGTELGSLEVLPK